MRWEILSEQVLQPCLVIVLVYESHLFQIGLWTISSVQFCGSSLYRNPSFFKIWFLLGSLRVQNSSKNLHDGGVLTPSASGLRAQYTRRSGRYLCFDRAEVRTVRGIQEHLWRRGEIPDGSTVLPLLVEYSLEFQRAIQISYHSNLPSQQEQSVYIIMSCMVTVWNLYRHRIQYPHFKECVTPLLYRAQNCLSCLTTLNNSSTVSRNLSHHSPIVILTLTSYPKSRPILNATIMFFVPFKWVFLENYTLFSLKKVNTMVFIKIVMTNREEGSTFLLHKTFSQEQIFSWQFPFRIILYRRHCHFMW